MKSNTALLLLAQGELAALAALGAWLLTSRGLVAPLAAVATGSAVMVATGTALAIWLDREP